MLVKLIKFWRLSRKTAGVVLSLASRNSFWLKIPVHTPIAIAPPYCAARMSFGCWSLRTSVNEQHQYHKNWGNIYSMNRTQTEHKLYGTGDLKHTCFHNIRNQNAQEETWKTKGNDCFIMFEWMSEHHKLGWRMVRGWVTVSPTWARKRNPPGNNCSARAVAILTSSPLSLWSLPNLYTKLRVIHLAQVTERNSGSPTYNVHVKDLE